MLNAIQTALSGLAASVKRVDASAQNIANSRTSGSLIDAENSPYTPVTTVQQAQGENTGGGVTAENIPIDQPFVPAFDPDSPFANAEGLVGAPNVNLAAEAVNLITAEVAYKANVSVIETASEMSGELLDLLDTDD